MYTLTAMPTTRGRFCRARTILTKFSKCCVGANMLSESRARRAWWHAHGLREPGDDAFDPSALELALFGRPLATADPFAARLATCGIAAPVLLYASPLPRPPPSPRAQSESFLDAPAAIAPPVHPKRRRRAKRSPWTKRRRCGRTGGAKKAPRADASPPLLPPPPPQRTAQPPAIVAALPLAAEPEPEPRRSARARKPVHRYGFSI